MRQSHPVSTELAELSAQLNRQNLGAILDTSRLARALYSSDASLYRVAPQAVARPRSVEELTAVLDVARDAGLSVTTRGAGTSCAGNAVGPGLIVDTSRHLNTIIEIDPEERVARVEPGVVQAALQQAAAPFGLRFGPDPSTHTRCTIGGMIGNNACGPRALGYGKTADNVVGLEAVTGAGERSPSATGPTSTAQSSGNGCNPWLPHIWPPSGPSSADSAARSRATAWSICYRRTVLSSPGFWPAPRAP